MPLGIIMGMILLIADDSNAAEVSLFLMITSLSALEGFSLGKNLSFYPLKGSITK